MPLPAHVGVIVRIFISNFRESGHIVEICMIQDRRARFSDPNLDDDDAVTDRVRPRIWENTNLLERQAGKRLIYGCRMETGRVLLSRYRWWSLYDSFKFDISLSDLSGRTSMSQSLLSLYERSTPYFSHTRPPTGRRSNAALAVNCNSSESVNPELGEQQKYLASI